MPNFPVLSRRPMLARRKAVTAARRKTAALGLRSDYIFRRMGRYSKPRLNWGCKPDETLPKVSPATNSLFYVNQLRRKSVDKDYVKTP